jgi:hypothetical protein
MGALGDIVPIIMPSRQDPACFRVCSRNLCDDIARRHGVDLGRYRQAGAHRPNRQYTPDAGGMLKG